MNIPHPLSLILLFPTVALLLLFFVPAQKVCCIRRISNIGALLSALLSVWVFASYDHIVGGFQFIDKVLWVAPFGISYHLGVDGINSVLVLLLGIASFAGVLITQSIKERVKEYYILLLLMIIGTYGAFLSVDIFFFYFFHEVAAIPAYLLIAVWGSGRKEYA
ncbi:MAG: NADH-quinone oxidoreductase subunit M, partial [Candidatus Omnitrophica bacterium]|nr:NADH-quinone oxidoreductase subunit M [Candidatus Omnitrophota bacterium]